MLLPAPTPTESAHAQALQLIERYGVVTREAVLAEGVVGGFANVYGVLKVLEERGQVRRGYFVDGLGAAQFALPGAVDRLRAVRETPDPTIRPDDVPAPIVLAATDPAQPYGAALSWPDSPGRPSRSANALVVLRAGMALAWFDRKGRHLVTFPATSTDGAWADALVSMVKDGRAASVEVRKVDGASLADAPADVLDRLRAVGSATATAAWSSAADPSRFPGARPDPTPWRALRRLPVDVAMRVVPGANEITPLPEIDDLGPVALLERSNLEIVQLLEVVARCRQRGPTDRSLTQLPWNPYGTRWGRWMRATSGPVMSSASRMHSSLASVVASYTTDRIQPASSAVPSAFGTNTGSAPPRPRPYSWACGGAGVDVDLEGGAVEVDAVVAHFRRVTVAVAVEPDPRVVAREFLGPVVDPGLGDAAGDRVDHPAVECRQRVAERAEPVGHHHRVVAAEVDHHGAVVGVEGVERVEHEARVDVAPDDLVGGAVAREEADAGGPVVLPRERERTPGHHGVEVHRDRQVVHDGVRRGERHVVHHRHVGHGDVEGLRDPPVRPTTT